MEERRGCACGKRRGGAGDGFTLTSAEDQYPPSLELEPTHREIHLDLFVTERRAAGRTITTVRGRHTDATALTLHAVGFSDVTVSSPDGHDLSSSYDGEAITITWSEAFSPGEERRVAIDYALHDPVSGLFFSSPSETYPDAPTFAATDNESERARHWLPCIDLPNVRTTVTSVITSDASHTILGPGVLLDEQVSADGRKTARWQLEQRCPSYILCITAGDFVRLDDRPAGPVDIAHFTTRVFDEDALARSFGRTPEIMEWLTAKLDHAFPYPKYYNFAVPGIGGAMENISLTSWDDKFVLDARLATEWQNLVDQINVHEMAHSYFGDLIVCRDFAHAWLKESWATFMELVWFEDVHGVDEGQLELYRKQRAYFQEADNAYKRPIVTRRFVSSWEMYDRHLYPGGACRLHMLRGLLGAENFWGAVQRYVRTFAGETVETDDFRRTLEAHTGRSLGRFFDQWFHSKGYPALEVTFNYDDKRKLGTFEITQTQVDAKADVPAFEFPLELGWMTDGERETTTVSIDREKQIVAVPMSADPVEVRIDPQHRLLHTLKFNPGDDKLIRQLREAPDVIGRIQAGEALAKTGKRKNLKALGAAYSEEGSYGVRAFWARAVADAGSQQAVDLLASWIRQEQHPMTLEPLFRAAARFRDPGISDALQHRLAGELPYLARQAALEGLGVPLGNVVCLEKEVDAVGVALGAADPDSYPGPRAGLSISAGHGRHPCGPPVDSIGFISKHPACGFGGAAG